LLSGHNWSKLKTITCGEAAPQSAGKKKIHKIGLNSLPPDAFVIFCGKKFSTTKIQAFGTQVLVQTFGDDGFDF
jgi:hypothetical protein